MLNMKIKPTLRKAEALIKGKTEMELIEKDLFQEANKCFCIIEEGSEYMANTALKNLNNFFENIEFETIKSNRNENYTKKFHNKKPETPDDLKHCCIII